MENVIHQLTLDLTGPDMCPMIEVQRGDSARSLIISLTQGGRPYWIDEGLTAALYGKKPDGNPLFNACTIEKNRVRYDFTPQTVNVAGVFDCEIWLVAGDKRELTTPKFTIAVDERMRTDDVIPESEPEYTAITEMVAAGTAMIEDLREALAGLEGVEEILAQARAATEAASGSEKAAAESAQNANAAAEAAETAAADALGYAEDAEAQAKAAKRSEDNSRLNLHEAEVAAQNAEAAAKRAEEVAALTADERSSLIAVVKAIGAFNVPNGQELIDAFNAAWGDKVSDEPEQPEKTLVSISATYSGGEVAVGTALSELTGVVVTAHYSDGATAAVTGYTLSGEIAEGSNTITITYGGKTATITVVGVASGDEEPAEPLYGRFWPPKGKVLDWNNHTWDDVENFAYTSNNAGTPTEYTNAGLPGASFVRLDKLQGTVYIRILTKERYGSVPNSYAVYANSDGEIATGGFENVPATIYRAFGGETKTMDVNGKTYYFMLFKFEIPVGQTGYFVSTQTAMKDGHFISADLTGIDDEYKPYYTLFGFDPSDRITEPATEVAL